MVSPLSKLRRQANLLYIMLHSGCQSLIKVQAGWWLSVCVARIVYFYHPVLRNLSVAGEKHSRITTHCLANIVKYEFQETTLMEDGRVSMPILLLCMKSRKKKKKKLSCYGRIRTGSICTLYPEYVRVSLWKFEEFTSLNCSRSFR